MSITSGAGVECLSAEIPDDRALLQESIKITFSNEDMEVGYPDHQMTLYLAASINQIHQESLGRYRCFCKSHSIEHFTSSKNFRKKDSGMPNGSDRVWRKGRIHRRPHPVVVESRPHSFFSSIPCGENGGLLSCAFGETMVAQTSIGPVHLSPVCERKIE